MKPHVWFRAMWDGNAGFFGTLAGLLLYPLELAYRALVGLRNRSYSMGFASQGDPSIPVIAIGNVAVGGTGKTPFAAWLVHQLEEMGRRPALVTRGYGLDEVELHRAWNPNALVVVDAERVRGVEAAVERGADVAVLDDAFQHRAIQRHLDIVLVAAEHGLSRRLLPRGRLREPLRSLGRADVVVVTRKSATWDEADAVSRQLPVSGIRARIAFEVDAWTDLAGASVAGPFGRDLLAVTSVAEPASFCEMVRSETACTVESLAFADHHEFDAEDVRRIVALAGERAVVMTEKDAVKLKAFAETLPTTFVLRLRLVWEAGLDSVMERITGVLEST